MPFEIIREDITRVEADAIVNTANPEPEIGGGTDWAIHAAAGPELLEARRQIGSLRPGQSAATAAFALPARYVLHTVGPVWIDGRHGEEELLRRAYDSALSLAAELDCRSVAFPLMAAGTYGFPRDLALATAVRAFTDFLLEHEMKIFLALFNAEAFGIARSLFDDLKSYVDDNYVERRIEEEYAADVTATSLPRGNARRAQTRRSRRAGALAGACFDAAPPAAGAPGGKAEKNRASRPLPLEELLSRQENCFSEYLRYLLREGEGMDWVVYKRAEVSRQLFSKILNNPGYQPTRSTAIQLAIGLQLDLNGTQKLLERAGYALTRSSKADLVVQYCIEKKLYSISFINEALLDCGLPLLKTGLKT